VLLEFLFPTLLGLATVQEPPALEVGVPVDVAIADTDAAVSTPTLDANYSQAPTVGKTFRLRVAEPGAYRIELRSYAFDAYLVLRDQDGALLGEDDDGLIGAHARVVATLEAGRDYLVTACALHGRRGAFTLTVLAGPPAPWSRAERLAAEDAEDARRIGFAESAEGVTSEAVARACAVVMGRLYGEGRYSQARPYGERALKILEELRGPEDPATVSTLNNLSVVIHRMGRLDEALPLLERALEIRERVLGPEHDLTSISLSNLALLLVEMGQLERARPLFERALAIREKVAGPEHPRTAVVLNGLGQLLHEQGRLEEARFLYERALAIYEQALGPEHVETATSVSNLALVLANQGFSEQAAALARRALAIREAQLGPDHPNTAVTRSNLAVMLENMGLAEEARELHRRTLESRERELGPDHPATANSLTNFARFLFGQGDYEESLRLYRRALAVREKAFGPEQPDVASSLNNLARVLQSRSHHQEALPLYERAAAIYEGTLGPEHPWTATCLDNLAHLHRLEGRHQEARRHFERALEGRLRYLARELPTMSEAGRLRLLGISARPSFYLASLAAAGVDALAEPFSLYLRWKGMATRLEAASLRLAQAGDSPEQLRLRGDVQALAKELAGLVFLPAGRRADDHAERIATLRAERLRLERELNRELGLDAILATPDAAAVQSALPADAVLVDFFVDEELFAWVLARSGEPRLLALGEAAPIRAAQQAYLRAAAVRGGASLDSGSVDPAAALRELLWEPLRELVGEAATVIVSPDGFLCELPFGLLREADGRYLIESHHFLYLSDATRLVGAADPRQDREGSVLAVGDVNYFRRDEAPAGAANANSTRSRVGDSWSSLPATRAELQTLEDLHDSVLAWESPLARVDAAAATEERVRQELPGKRYVHLATHGYFEPDHLPSLLRDAEEKEAKADLDEQVQAVGLLPGLLSGLVFAGVNGEADPARDDGYLSAEEIQHLDLSACELVVLSACETALGSARAGEGLMSLRRAFEVAGADSVISSLWKVDDAATAQLMKSFYENLWVHGMSRLEALHQAKLRLLRQNRAETGGDTRPSTWGAFVLSGDWR